MHQSTPWLPVDPLADMLHSVRMRGIYYCHSELTAPWTLEMPAVTDSLSFHVVLDGHARLLLPGESTLELRVGDVAFVPHGRGHLLDHGATTVPARRVDRLPQDFVSDHYSRLTYGGGTGDSAEMICGIVYVDEPAGRELLRRLPAHLHLTAPGVRTESRLRSIFELLTAELSQVRPGSETVATRLADILVIEALRLWIAEHPEEGWLAALRDRHIGAALHAIHRAPGDDWTVEKLAGVAHLSRSAFSAEFSRLLGESPIAYLTRWRMTLAETKLRDGGTTVSAVASELGYHSESAFSRAFARETGRRPGQVRPG